MVEVQIRLRCDLCGGYAKGYPFEDVVEWYLGVENEMREPFKLDLEYQSLADWVSVYWQDMGHMLHFCPTHKVARGSPVVDGKQFSEHLPLAWKSKIV